MKQILEFNNINFKLPETQSWLQDVISAFFRSTDYFKATADKHFETSVVSIFGGKGSLCNHPQTLPGHIISGVTCKSQKRGENSFPSHLYSGWQIEASLGDGWKPRAAGWRPETQNQRRSGLCTWNTEHYTNGEKVKSRASQMFVLHFVFGWKVVYSTSCSQERGQCMWFAGSTVEVDDKSVDVDTPISRWKISVLVKVLRTCKKHHIHIHTT